MGVDADQLAAVRQWARKADEARAARNMAIAAAVGSGLSLRTVADAAGLSHAAVAKIAARI